MQNLKCGTGAAFGAVGIIVSGAGEATGGVAAVVASVVGCAAGDTEEYFSENGDEFSATTLQVAEAIDFVLEIAGI